MLKKIILAALVVTSAVFAQINVGGRAAVSFGTFWGDDATNASWGIGFNAGAAAKIGINQMLSFVPGLEVDYRRISDEVEMEMMGAKLEAKNTTSMLYLEAPLLLRVNAAPQFFFDAGLTVAFNLSANNHSEATTEYGGRSETEESDDDISDGTEALEIGLIAGLGYTVIPNLDLNLRFAVGLTSVGKGGDAKNMRIQAGATYWFM